MPEVLSDSVLRNERKSTPAWCRESAEVAFVTKSKADNLAVMSIDAHGHLANAL